MTAYVLEEAAEHELREIFHYVSRDSGESRASHVLNAFLEAFDSLSASPGIGFLRRGLTGDELRWWPVFRWLVLYDPNTQPLRIVGIWHSSRDLARIFREPN